MKRSTSGKRAIKSVTIPRRTSPTHSRKKRGLFAKIGFNLKRWGKKFNGTENTAKKTLQKRINLSQAPLTADLLEDLKIAIPKPGRTIPSRPRFTLPYLGTKPTTDNPQQADVANNPNLAEIVTPENHLGEATSDESFDASHIANNDFMASKPRSTDLGDSYYSPPKRENDTFDESIYNPPQEESINSFENSASNSPSPRGNDDFGASIGYNPDPVEADDFGASIGYNPDPVEADDFGASTVYNPDPVGTNYFNASGDFGASTVYNPDLVGTNNFGASTVYNPPLVGTDDFGALRPAPKKKRSAALKDRAASNPPPAESEAPPRRRRRPKPQLPENSQPTTKDLAASPEISPKNRERSSTSAPPLKSRAPDDAPRRRPKKKQSLEGSDAIIPQRNPRRLNREDSSRVRLVRPAPVPPFSGGPKFKSGKKPSRSLRRPILIGSGIGLAIIAAILVGVYKFSDSIPLIAKVPRIPVSSLPSLVTSLSPGLYELQAIKKQKLTTNEVTIKAGSSLSEALDAVGVGTAQNSPAIIARLGAEDALSGVVRPGDKVRAIWADSSKTKVSRLEYHQSSKGAPLVMRPTATNTMWLYDLASQPLTINAAREATVKSSLWAAGSKVGLDANIIMSLTDILASEVDFLTDIKSGDTLQVLYSRDYQDGHPIGSPTINMVKMANQGRDYELYRYINSKGDVGYFNPKGHSNLKTFFLSPLQYKRISSKFSMTRMHPVLKKVRPHQGVDYAAPTGTPVSAIADGTVIFCGWNGGFGRLVTIKHNDTYTTMNAHLSRFAPGLKKGSVVKQGDLIGNVGASGMVTGPHLDFRLKKNGVFIDPIPELAKQKGKLLEAAEAQAFTQMVTRYRNQMTYQLANNE